jgi:hypothetical protein
LLIVTIYRHNIKFDGQRLSCQEALKTKLRKANDVTLIARALGKGEVVSSILTGSTIGCPHMLELRDGRGNGSPLLRDGGQKI